MNDIAHIDFFKRAAFTQHQVVNCVHFPISQVPINLQKPPQIGPAMNCMNSIFIFVVLRSNFGYSYHIVFDASTISVETNDSLF